MKIRHILPVVLTFAFVAAAPADEIRHFGLESSSPAAGETVTAPNEIHLTFTQVPQDGTVRIRLVEAEDAGVHVMDAVADEEDPKTFSVVIHGTLPPATYTVSWRGMGDDGHVVRDTFQFVIATK